MENIKTMFKGWRTILINAGMVAVTAGLTSLAGFDWVGAVGPTMAVVIMAGINWVLRFMTDTKIGSKE